jgi:hypothetical protein
MGRLGALTLTQTGNNVVLGSAVNNMVTVTTGTGSPNTGRHHH